MMDIIETIKIITAPMQRKIWGMVARGIIKTVNDSGNLQSLQLSLLADELSPDMPRIQEYGFTSHPLPGAEAAVVFLGGNRDHGIVIGVEDRRYRIKGLARGEVAVYNFEGSQLVWRSGNKLEVSNGTEELITVLSDLLAWMTEAEVLTAIGPQRFTAAKILTLQAIKTRLDTFKVV